MQQTKSKVKKLTQHDLVNIKVLNDRQEEALHCFHNFDIISLLGSAGTGKTFLACYMALNAIANHDYSKLLIVRSAVPTREIGYLPGTREEKEEVYERPYFTIFDELLKYKSNNYQNMKEIGIVQFESTSYLRGTTFDNTIILFDEVQNATFQELDTVMTRVGKNSKVVLIGDGRQADLQKNGLYKFMSIVSEMRSYAGVEFTVYDVVRSGIVKEYLIAKEHILSLGD